MKKTEQKGGARPGAGRDSIYDEPMQTVSVRIPQTHITYLMTMGDGNVSAGLRELIERYQNFEAIVKKKG